MTRSAIQTQFFHYAVLAAIIYIVQVRGYPQLRPCCGFQEGCSTGGFYPGLSNCILIEPWPPCHLHPHYPVYQQGFVTLNDADWNLVPCLPTSSSSSNLYPLKTDDNLTCIPCSRTINYQRAPAPLSKYSPHLPKKNLGKRESPKAVAQHNRYVPDPNSCRIRRQSSNPFYHYDDTNYSDIIPSSSPYLYSDCSPEDMICNDLSNYGSSLPRQDIKFVLLNSNSTLSNKIPDLPKQNNTC